MTQRRKIPFPHEAHKASGRCDNKGIITILLPRSRRNFGEDTGGNTEWRHPPWQCGRGPVEEEINWWGCPKGQSLRLKALIAFKKHLKAF